MDTLTLLDTARRAGLSVRADGDKLIVRGPKSAEALALAVLDCKTEVLELLGAADDAAEVNYRLDPRPDIAADHPLWVRLLARAYALDGDRADGLYGALHGLRCLGARLADDGAGVRLLPGELFDGEYGRLRRRWLVPHRAAMIALLSALGAT